MRRALPLVVLVVLIFAVPAQAAGLLLPRDGSPPIAVRSHRVTAVVKDGLARTTLRQTFVNPHSRMLEAIYLFPLPEGAALVDVAMEVGGQRLEGLLAERQRARKIYNDIVREKRDPALVEQIGRSTFRLSVFPVMPKEDTVVELTWIERIPLEQGRFRYVYPLATGGKATETKQDLTITVRLESSVPFTDVKASIPDMQVIRPEAGVAVASLERSRGRLDEDVVITARVETQKPSLAVSVYKEETEDGWFLAVVTPPNAREDQLIPRDVILVIDTSGSMKSDGKIDQAKQSALWLLDHLRPVDRVNVLRFSSDVQAYADAPVPANEANLSALRKFVSSFSATGSTALGEALLVASRVEKAEGRVRTVVLLTDGRPTIGETDPVVLVEHAKSGAARGLRFFPFGVGSDLDTGLLRGIASAGRGRAEVFRPGGEIVTRLTRFLDRTSSPVISDIEFTVDGVPVYDVFPRPLPDIYLGEQLAITGRYRESGAGKVTVSAIIGTERRQLATQVLFPAEPAGSPTVAHLFARQKLDYLEEALRLRAGLSDDAYYAALDRGAYSSQGEIVSEIVSVSLAHGVQCAYTSFLVLLPEDKRRLDPSDLAAVRAALDRVRTVRREKAGLPAEETARNERGVREKGRSDDPTIRDAKVSDHNETDNDLPFEESLGRDGISDAPFEGPSTNGSIGIGGGAGGSFGGRGAHRNLKARGGGKATKNAVDLALEWLKNHQRADGRWDADGFTEQCKLNECGGAGAATQDPAVSGLAVLAFLGAGESHKHGRYKKCVRNGLRWLKQIQDPEGCFGPRDAGDFLLQHAICTLAMAEAYALTASPLFKESAQLGIDFLVDAERPGASAWGRKHRDKVADPATSFWAICALKSAKAGALRVPQESLDGFRFWLLEATDEEYGAVAPVPGVVLPGTRQGCTAAGILGRIFTGEAPRKSEAIGKAADLCMNLLPTWDEAAPDKVDLGYWYFGTLSCFQIGGGRWKTWNKNLLTHVTGHQRKDGDEKGSWDPLGPDGKRLGRVGATALLAMCNQVYYRYARVFGTR